MSLSGDTISPQPFFPADGADTDIAQVTDLQVT